MTESEVRKLLRQMKEQDSQTAFRDFYDMTYDRLFRIAYYYVKQEEWSQEIVLDVFLKLWKQRSTLLDVRNIEDYCFILVKNASLNYLEKESKHIFIHSDSLPEPQEQSYSPEECVNSGRAVCPLCEGARPPSRGVAGRYSYASAKKNRVTHRWRKNWVLAQIQ